MIPRTLELGVRLIYPVGVLDPIIIDDRFAIDVGFFCEGAGFGGRHNLRLSLFSFECRKADNQRRSLREISSGNVHGIPFPKRARHTRDSARRTGLGYLGSKQERMKFRGK